MKKKKIVTILGARPQFIKACVVSRAIDEVDFLDEVVIHTGQHFDTNMSDVFFRELGIKEPKYRLNIHGGSHGEMTGRMLGSIEAILSQENPDLVLVYGDTNSTLAGALAAVKLHIPIAHVEAGLRSFNMFMPEEVNRILTDRISNWLFTPTSVASRNLLSEGIQETRIFQVGDVMYDVALLYGDRVKPYGGIIAKLGLTSKSFVLATVHRAENTDDPDRMRCISEGLSAVSRSVPVVWPLHPRTRKVLDKYEILKGISEGVHLIEPVGYIDMVQLEKYSAVIATDSGGVQKEAFFYGVPCVTLRSETEWNELVDRGWNHLVSPCSVAHIVSNIHSAIGCQGQAFEPYGKGDSAKKIVEVLSV